MSRDTISLILAAIFALVFIFRVRSGWKRGAIREFFSLVKFALSLVCLWMVWLIYTYIRNGEYFKIFVPAGVIGALSFIFRLVGRTGYTLTGLREAGPIRLVDSLAGACAGAAEAFLLLWFMRYLMGGVIIPASLF